MSAKYTPGPWTFLDHSLSMYDAELTIHSESENADSSVVAYVPGHEKQKRGKTVLVLTKETFANARLIAAAPELLAVCQNIHDELTLGSEHHERLSAAIAKATGAQA